IPSAIANYMPKGLIEQFADPEDNKPGRPQLNSSSVYATARKAVQDAKAAGGGDFYFDTVTAGGGAWYLFAGATTGGVELVAAPDGANANKPAYAQQAFAHLHDVVVADARDRLLHYDRDAVVKWDVSPLSFVDEKDIRRGDRAIALLPILVAGETRDEDDWVFEPEDTEGNSFGTISCAVSINDPSSSSSEEMTVNKVFIAQNVDKAIETLESGDAASKRLANGEVQACEGIAIDGVETDHGYGI
ncbi:hypothetical protein DIS24_g11877, partial [Lasiodiplodia hormozganensis]